MSLTNRNNRSIHGDAKRIKANLADHTERTAAYRKRGFCQLHASKWAYNDMRGVANPPKSPATCSECGVVI